ncbi:hypothetical protein FQA39_LY03393 [Lamprigera yunnana]|nr:hypothetical protein FQA39_LY03393 [Lamprigera yunnana]
MCKGCQYCLESCYWHLIEKRFCYDENIALYEEPFKKEERQQSHAFENIAFYDQVALIAGRSIVTIDALPKEPKPIAQQPRPTVRWWEDNVIEQNKENEFKNNKIKKTSSILKKEAPTIVAENQEQFKEKVTPPVDRTETITIINTSLLQVHEPVKLRKKSLAERRASRSLTLNIDRNLELPIIRQMSIPKFYIDTPEANQMDPNNFKEPSSVLTSPLIKDSSELFDLRSIVLWEMDNRNLQSTNVAPVHKQLSNAHSRLSIIKEKLKTTKLKKQASTSNLPHSVQHI